MMQREVLEPCSSFRRHRSPILTGFAVLVAIGLGIGTLLSAVLIAVRVAEPVAKHAVERVATITSNPITTSSTITDNPTTITLSGSPHRMRTTCDAAIGNDNFGSVTIGGANSGCSVTFDWSWVYPPVCVASNVRSVTASRTGLMIVADAHAEVQWQCIGASEPPPTPGGSIIQTVNTLGLNLLSDTPAMPTWSRDPYGSVCGDVVGPWPTTLASVTCKP